MNNITLMSKCKALHFDVSQTEGESLPELDAPELLGSVENYSIFMQSVRQFSPVPIRFDEIHTGAKGYYSNMDKEIVIQKGMSESQTMKTGIHETAHAILHDKDVMEETGEKKDRMTKEAESIAFTVCSYFGLDTSDYSFPYIAGWSVSREMAGLRSLMETICRTAGDFIEGMERIMRELQKECKTEREIGDDDLVFKVSFLGMETDRYYLVDNVGNVDLVRLLYDYTVQEMGEFHPESYLTEHGVHLYLWKDSENEEKNSPMPDFYDVLYTDEGDIVDTHSLSSVLQAEIGMNRAEYGGTVFNEEQRKLVTDYAYKFDNPHETQLLIKELSEAMEKPDIRAVCEVMDHAQSEIEELPDPEISLTEIPKSTAASPELEDGDEIIELGDEREEVLAQMRGFLAKNTSGLEAKGLWDNSDTAAELAVKFRRCEAPCISRQVFSDCVDLYAPSSRRQSEPILRTSLSGLINYLPAAGN